ncbi:hypothetical protein SGLAM104S_06621 [Streptomyces glaucescens]
MDAVTPAQSRCVGEPDQTGGGAAVQQHQRGAVGRAVHMDPGAPVGGDDVAFLGGVRPVAAEFVVGEVESGPGHWAFLSSSDNLGERDITHGSQGV